MTLFSRDWIAPFEAKAAPVWFGSTLDGNPVGCAAALATLDFLEEQDLHAAVTREGRWLKSQLSELIGHSSVAAVRGMGFMLSLDCAHNSGKGTRFSASDSLAVRQKCESMGLLVDHSYHGLSLFPALISSRDDLQDIVSTLTTVLTLHPTSIHGFRNDAATPGQPGAT